MRLGAERSKEAAEQERMLKAIERTLKVPCDEYAFPTLEEMNERRAFVIEVCTFLETLSCRLISFPLLL